VLVDAQDRRLRRQLVLEIFKTTLANEAVARVMRAALGVVVMRDDRKIEV
jgi:hypothetical protein